VRQWRRVPAAFGALVAGALLVSCDRTPQPPPPLRQWTDHFLFTISSDPAPARAREPIVYKVVVRDKESGEPLESGEGRIFATRVDSLPEGQISVWDGLAAGPELGTYYGKLSFITSGEWAVAIQFRRDSTHALERSDWRQTVFNERARTP
jgi:hypothetical protein